MASERSSAGTPNHVINHIALAVDNAQKAVEWYRDIFGFELIGDRIHTVSRAEHPTASTFDIYPESLQELRVGCMATGNGVGLEIIEFVNPHTYLPTHKFEKDYQRGGFFHLCITDPDPDSLAERIVARGGRRIGLTVRPVSPVKCLYAADPWGNVVEILDISFERFASLFYPGHR